MDIEFAVLCKALEVRGFDQLVESRITHGFFMDPDNAAVFDWAHSHWERYGESPGEEAFRHEYPADQLIETQEPLSYYIDELRAQRKYALVTGMLDQVKDPLKEGDTDMAIKIMAAGLEALHVEVVDLHNVDANRTQADRWAHYKYIGSNPGLMGIPTGFPSMDQATAGLQKQQLVTLVGLQKAFKSMLLMQMNIAANNAGHRTLFASFEMTNQEQLTRHDALRAGVSLGRLQRGRLEEWEWKKLRRMHHATEDSPPMVYVHDPAGTTTVSALAAQIRKERPDVAFVDGTYLMDAEVERADPGSAQALTSITRSLKRLAQLLEIPIVQTTQALSWKARGGKLSLDSIGYSSSFAQDSDVIFGVEEIKDNDHEIKLRILASRNCPRHDVVLALDLDHGSIMETEEIDYGADDDLDEEE